MGIDNPPPPFGQFTKENDFFLTMSSLSQVAKHEVKYIPISSAGLLVIIVLNFEFGQILPPAGEGCETFVLEMIRQDAVLVGRPPWVAAVGGVGSCPGLAAAGRSSPPRALLESLLAHLAPTTTPAPPTRP